MDLMSASGCDCAGLTRALKTDSEAVIRVVAVPLPTVEIKHVSSQRDRLHINMQYLHVLADETGELHWPKRTRTGSRSRCRTTWRTPCAR